MPELDTITRLCEEAGSRRLVRIHPSKGSSWIIVWTVLCVAKRGGAVTLRRRALAAETHSGEDGDCSFCSV